MDKILHKSHINQLNLIHEKIVSILSVLDALKKLEFGDKSKETSAINSFISLTRWKFLTFFTTIYGNIQDTFNLRVLPIFKTSLQNAKCYDDYTKEIECFINDISIIVFINKESFCVCKTLNLIIQLGQDFVNVWKENQKDAIKKLREIYLRANERIELLKDQLVLIGKILKNENYYNLSRCI